MRLISTSQVGQLLSARRLALRMSQKELAARIGLSQNRLSEIEADPAGLTLERLLTLVSALGFELVLQDKKNTQPGSGTAW